MPGDDPAVIASGPTVPDPTTFADARAVLAKYRIDEPLAVIAHLAAQADETPKPGDPIFARARFELIASPLASLRAAADAALRQNITPIVLSDRIEGEARDVALVHAAIARQLRAGEFRVGDRAVPLPAVLLSGGETTVTVAARAAAGATSSSCWRSLWRSTARRASRRSPATPTASTEPRTMPGRSSIRTASRGPPRSASAQGGARRQ